MGLVMAIPASIAGIKVFMSQTATPTGSSKVPLSGSMLDMSK